MDREKQQPTSTADHLDGKQEKLIGQPFAHCIEVDDLAQLDSLANNLAVTGL
jgi:hypothetical protein